MNNMSKKKVLITGSKGFIGKHIAEALGGKVEIQECDLPECDLLKPIKGIDADVVIHVAAIDKVEEWKIVEYNIRIAYNLVSALKESKPRLIYLSSIHAKNPQNAHGLSKQAIEIILKSYCQEHKIPLTIFRPTNAFGEGCKPFYNSVVATFCYQVANGEKVRGGGFNKEIILIYVKDLAKIVAKETTEKKPFCLKEITSGNRITIGQLLKLIRSFKQGKKPEGKFQKDLYRTYRTYCSFINET